MVKSPPLFVSSSSTIRNTHTQSHQSPVHENLVFDHPLKTLQRDGAARSYKLWRAQSASSSPSNNNKSGDEFVDYDYFSREIAYRLVDRLDDIKRDQGFPLALDIGMYIKKTATFIERIQT